MKENERILREWKQQPQQQHPSQQQQQVMCAKCGEPLEGETVELQQISKEYHKRYVAECGGFVMVLIVFLVV